MKERLYLKIMLMPRKYFISFNNRIVGKKHPDFFQIQAIT